MLEKIVDFYKKKVILTEGFTFECNHVKLNMNLEMDIDEWK